jgi:hypothetical protein
MNIQRLPDHVLRWGATLGGLFLAFFLARAAGQGQVGMVSLILFLVFLGLATLAAKERIWVLVPIAWGLAGKIPALNLPFALRDLVVFWVFGAFLMLKAFKLARRSPTLGKADFLLFAMGFYLVVGFIRNPVGFEVFGSDRVGGRPYYTIFVASLAYWVLVRVSLRPASSNRMAGFLAVGRLFDGVTAQLLHWIPPLIPFFAMYYVSDIHDAIDSGIRINPMSGIFVETSERLGYLMAIGYPILAYMAARYPMPALLNPTRPWRIGLVILGFLCVLFSGFRSMLVLSTAGFIVAGYFYRGRSEVARMLTICAILLFVLALGNGNIFDLPKPAQRALSWLPGNWDDFAVRDAKGSTEWRLEMWDIMLNTNRYIDNHWLGDGFGFKKRDLEQMNWNIMYGSGAGSQEEFMIMGGVHSGPVSAIRFVGYVGLALYLVLLTFMAIEAWRCCIRAKGTPFQILAFFVAIPIIIEPLFFVLIFGAFDASVPNTIFALGMLRMIKNSLDDYTQTLPVQVSVKSPEPAVDQPMLAAITSR